MSHFNVLVIQDEKSPSIDEMLAPYNEADEAYFGFVDHQDLIEKFFADDPRGYESVDEMAEKFFGSVKDEKTGRWGGIGNPNAKWDYWVIGGDWEGTLRLKSGAAANSAPAGQLDFSPDEKAYAAAVEHWESNMASDSPDWGWDPRLDNKAMAEAYGDADAYARSCTSPGTWAVVTPDGQWHEPGHVGWFGTSDASLKEEARWNAEFHDRFLKGLDPACTVTVVDCHI